MSIKTITFYILLLSCTAVHAEFKNCRQIHSIDLFGNNFPKDKNLETKLPKSFIELAYLKQACTNNIDQENIIGYKAGLTSEVAQVKFNLNEPIFGVLKVANELINPNIRLTEETLLLEAELAFSVKKDIAEISDVNADIYDLVDAVMPVVEIPKIDSKNIVSINIINIIKKNVGAYKFYLGKKLSLAEIDINKIRVKIYKDKELFGEGVSNIPMGDQVKATKWLIKRALLEGYEIRRGDILLTGATTKPLVLIPGEYTFDFDRLGVMNLSVLNSNASLN